MGLLAGGGEVVSSEADDFGDWMTGVQARTERDLDAMLPSADSWPQVLHTAMRYAVLEGGKRVRPLLVYAAGEISRAPRHRLAHAAAAIELIHAYSLVHDDMPCMDNDSLRRGKPTVHVAHGEATALLVGDALQSLAFEVLSEPDLFDDAKVQLSMVRQLADAAGSRGMAGGQAVDLASVRQPLDVLQLEAMHRAKTGALLRAAVRLGVECGVLVDRTTFESLDRYAGAVGLAFQVVDDVLDVETDSAVLGKTAGKDAENDKPTYVSVLGMDAARSLAHRLREEALDALEGIDHARRLRELAEFVVRRRF